MLHALDRFVLNKYEKSYQFLQKHFGLKISTAVDIALILTNLSFWGLVYFHDQIEPRATVFFAVLASLMTVAILLYIFIASPKIQNEAEKWAGQGVSNPLKVSREYTAMRCGICSGAISSLIFFSFINELAGLAISIQFIFISFCSAAYLFSIDILPPSSSKEDSWLRNLFRRRATST